MGTNELMSTSEELLMSSEQGGSRRRTNRRERAPPHQSQPRKSARRLSCRGSHDGAGDTPSTSTRTHAQTDIPRLE
jgi:hypothetical protein